MCDAVSDDSESSSPPVQGGRPAGLGPKLICRNDIWCSHLLPRLVGSAPRFSNLFEAKFNCLYALVVFRLTGVM